MDVLRVFFGFQAEDGIRDWSVTGVQTCALLFSSRRRHTRLVSDWSSDVCSSDLGVERVSWPDLLATKATFAFLEDVCTRVSCARLLCEQIGRASCRERV